MTPRLLPRQVQIEEGKGKRVKGKGLFPFSFRLCPLPLMEANFTRYDFREGFSRRLLFPVKRGSIQEILSQTIVFGYFPDTLDNLVWEERLVGGALELWLKTRKEKDHAQAGKDTA